MAENNTCDFYCPKITDVFEITPVKVQIGVTTTSNVCPSIDLFHILCQRRATAHGKHQHILQEGTCSCTDVIIEY